jgi:hypothetical protein
VAPFDSVLGKDLDIVGVPYSPRIDEYEPVGYAIVIIMLSFYIIAIDIITIIIDRAAIVKIAIFIILILFHC